MMTGSTLAIVIFAAPCLTLFADTGRAGQSDALRPGSPATETEGEDVGRPRSEGVYERIGRRMEAAQLRISRLDTSEQTQVIQQQVIDDLDELIYELAKKGNAGGSSQGQPKPDSRSQTGKAPSQPAQDSVTRLGQGAAAPPDAEAVRQMIQRAWGHLPPALREPMLNPGFERFLPKYETLIEQYFQRLADETDRVSNP